MTGGAANFLLVGGPTARIAGSKAFQTATTRFGYAHFYAVKVEFYPLAKLAPPEDGF
ncbi:hypothetical protein ACFQX4_27440 [Roseomonas sp. GCM10028921]